MKKIIEFQRQQGLSPDGIIGKNTIDEMKKVWGIPMNTQIANFLGQVHHETGGFKRGIENTNYSVDRMLEIHKSDFDIDKDKKISEKEREKAVSIFGKPIQIANFVYANQNGNGTEASGDGWAFRGAGAIQLTGRRNYDLFKAWLVKNNLWKQEGQSLTAELIDGYYYWETALFYFTVNGLWNQSKYIDTSAIKLITKKINGGYNGLDDRIAKTQYYYKIATQK